MGNYQPKMTISGVLYADGVRVGLEDNLYYDEERKILATNESLLNRVLDASKLYDRPLYSCDEARELIGIGRKPVVIRPKETRKLSVMIS